MALLDAPETTLPVERTETGQFPAGVSGNPLGRPKGSRNKITELQQQLELSVLQHVKPDRIKKIWDKMCTLAEGGDKKAAKLIFDTILTKATPGNGDGSDGPNVIVFRVENVTYAAKAATTPSTEIIEAEVINGKQQEAGPSVR